MDTPIILIGGPPGAGKTTLGRALADALGVVSLTCDDLVQAAKGVTTAESHPDLHALSTDSSVRMFTRSTPDELIRGVMRQHRGSWPAVERVIRGRVRRRESAVIDGCALQPAWVAELALPDVWSTWLDVDRAVLESRERGNPFFAASDDPERMLQNFLARSAFYNEFIRDEARACGFRVLVQDGSLSVEALRDRVLEEIAAPPNR